MIASFKRTLPFLCNSIIVNMTGNVNKRIEVFGNYAEKVRGRNKGY